MKTTISVQLILLLLTIGNLLYAQSNGGPKLPVLNQDSITTGVPDSESITDEELQAPPAGEISKLDIRYLQKIDGVVATLLTSAPDDPNGKQSTWYPKLQAWKASLDQLLSSHKQVDAFKMIPTMADYFARNKTTEDPTLFLGQTEDQMNDCARYIIKAAASYVSQQNAIVDAATLSNFVKMFAIRGFVLETNWENEAMPIDAGGVMTLDATAVVSQLKTGPWQQTQQFVGGDSMTSTNFFARYESSGDGLAVLKSKYQQNRSAILSKFDELKSWVLQQEHANGGH